MQCRPSVTKPNSITMTLVKDTPCRASRVQLSFASQAATHTCGWPGTACTADVNVNVNVNNLLAISKSDFDNSGEPGTQAEGVNHLETPLRPLQVTHRASSCAKRGGHAQLGSKPRGARGIEPKTFRRRGQLSSCPPTTVTGG